MEQIIVVTNSIPLHSPQLASELILIRQCVFAKRFGALLVHVLHVSKFIFGNNGQSLSRSGRIARFTSVDAKLCPGRLRNCLVIPERTPNRGVSGRCVHDDLVGPRDTREIVSIASLGIRRPYRLRIAFQGVHVFARYIARMSSHV